ncbi:hypothetical protein XCR_4379 [Xanthomonas campestris pv. raphani 756C]|nr:hypothetical protein XCR_4379 [Xanthomonas campestris pv. raphani 756C]
MAHLQQPQGRPCRSGLGRDALPVTPQHQPQRLNTANAATR